MLGTRNAVANLAVSDIGRARAFFTKTLGLKQVGVNGP
jgi:catechol 2,3-dioxygenase-like lactoylglutathione lyase family enzyme